MSYQREYKAMTVACSAALLTLVPVALHQLGFLEHLPDPPVGVFASDVITGSKAAHPFRVPDSLPGLASYGATLALLSAAPRSRRMRKALAWKLLLDGALAGINTGRELAGFRRLCSWCSGTALSTAAMLYAGRGLIAEELNLSR